MLPSHLLLQCFETHFFVVVGLFFFLAQYFWAHRVPEGAGGRMGRHPVVLLCAGAQAEEWQGLSVLPHVAASSHMWQLLLTPEASPVFTGVTFHM